MVDKSKALSFGSNWNLSLGGTSMLGISTSLKEEVEWDEPSDNAFIGTTRPEKAGRQVIKKDVKGQVTVRPSYAHADELLAILFDGASSPYTPADDPTAIDVDVVIDREVDIFTYADCWLQSLELTGNPNEPIDWILDLLGKLEVDSGAVAALTIPDKMLFSDLTLTIGGDTYFPTGFTWKFMYDLEERFHNSLTRSSVGFRIPRLEIGINFDTNDDTWADLQNKSGLNTAIANTNLVFTNGANTLSLLTPECTVMNPSKWVDGEGVEARKFDLQLRAWSATAEADICSMTYA